MENNLTVTIKDSDKLKFFVLPQKSSSLQMCSEVVKSDSKFKKSSQLLNSGLI